MTNDKILFSLHVFWFSFVVCSCDNMQTGETLHFAIFLSDFTLSLVIRQRFFLPKQFQKSRSALQGRSRSWGLFRKGETHIVAKCHRAVLVIFSHSRRVKPHLIA